MWKTLRIDTRTKEIKIDEYKTEYRLLGGRSLIAQFLLDEVDPTCDPLGPMNKLIFCTSLLSGTGITSTNRLSVGGKSPLTGGIKESNAGGMGASLMARQGLKMIIFENIPLKIEWQILHICPDGRPELIGAEDLCGKGTYDCVSSLIERYGDGIGVMVIGDGGEKGYKSAGIAVNEFRSNYPCRLAARGGLGSLMASKGIKAVVIEPPVTDYKQEMADETKFNELKLAFNQAAAKESRETIYSKIGTIATIEGTSAAGVLPTKNFSGEYFKNHEDIGAARFMENLKKRGGKNHIACQPGCVVCCSNHYNDENGNHITSGLEYETVGLCGSNLNINDLDMIARIDRICDDMGLDTIEIGSALGICMYEGKIPWGDTEGVFRLLDEIRDGTSFGQALGNGAASCGAYLDSTHIPVCKGQAMAAYEPRNLLGTGITYATSPQGADHTAGVTFGMMDGTDTMMQMYLSKMLQTMMCGADQFICVFAWSTVLNNLELFSGLMDALYGVPYGMEQIMGAATQTLLKERTFNSLAGFTVKDDDVPAFMHDEPSPYTGNTFDFTPGEMASIFDIL